MKWAHIERASGALREAIRDFERHVETPRDQELLDLLREGEVHVRAGMPAQDRRMTQGNQECESVESLLGAVR